MKGPARLTAACILILAIASPAALAQEPAEQDTVPVFRLPPVQVQVARGLRPAERIPAAFTTVGRDAIQRGQPGIGLEEALVAVPGVMVSNRHNFAVDSRVSIRGFGAGAGFGVRGVRLVMDGIPLTMPDGQATLNSLVLGSAGRIEILRGPASTLYGNAAGGVISIETEEAPLSRLGAEARITAGTQGSNSLGELRKLDAKVGGRTAAADYVLGMSHLRMDGFREHARTEHSAVAGRARFVLGPVSQLTLVLHAADMPLAQNPGSLPADSARERPDMAWPVNVRQGAGKTARHVQGGATYSRAVGSGRFDASLYALDRNMENPLPFAYIVLDRTGSGVRLTYRDSLDLAGTPAFLTVGMDGESQRDERREFVNVQGSPADVPRRNQRDAVRSTAPFVQLQLGLRSDLEAAVGLRYDRVAFRTVDRPSERINPQGNDQSGGRTLSSPSGSIGLVHLPAAGLAFYVTFATSFQTPTTTELINAPPGSVPPGAGGFNPELEPERARSIEIGARGRPGNRIRIEAVAFWMNVQDKLVPFQVPEEPDRNFYRNAAAARHRGVELAAGLALGRGWSLDAAYTYSDFRLMADDLRDTGGNRVPGVPPHRLFARLGVTTVTGAFAEARAETVSAAFADDANLHRNGGYTVLDLRAGLDPRGGRIGLAPFVGINNVLDARYNGSVVVNAAGNRYFEPSPGRSFYFGLSAPVGWHRESRER